MSTCQTYSGFWGSRFRFLASPCLPYGYWTPAFLFWRLLVFSLVSLSETSTGTRGCTSSSSSSLSGPGFDSRYTAPGGIIPEIIIKRKWLVRWIELPASPLAHANCALASNLGRPILRVGTARQSIKIYSILFYFIIPSRCLATLAPDWSTYSLQSRINILGSHRDMKWNM